MTLTDSPCELLQLAVVAPFGERSGMSLVALSGGGGALLLGGCCYFNDVWATGDGGATWKEVSAAAPWSKRYNFGAAMTQLPTLVVSGEDDGGHVGTRAGFAEVLVVAGGKGREVLVP